MAFTLLGGVLNVIGQLVQNRGSDELQQGGPAGYLLLALGGLAAGVASNIWLNVGLLRGSRIALAEGQPRFAELARWEGAATLRLLGMAALLLMVNGLVLITCGLVAGVLSVLTPGLGLLALVLGGAALMILNVSQVFQLPLVVVGRLGPVLAFQRGWSRKTRGWAPLYLLTLALHGLQVLLVLLVPTPFAALAVLLAVGLLIAWPVMIASLMAGYDALFGRDFGRGGTAQAFSER
ncbi:hypothetical protein KBY97_04165 [Synechococcus sp. ATX 2A4]|nr:hypothetical protein [Synechococcus sp. ATX 2A4]